MPKFIAKKNHNISLDGVNITHAIIEGEEFEIPERFVQNLITEGVIDLEDKVVSVKETKKQKINNTNKG